MLGQLLTHVAEWASEKSLTAPGCSWVEGPAMHRVWSPEDLRCVRAPPPKPCFFRFPGPWDSLPAQPQAHF